MDQTPPISPTGAAVLPRWVPIASTVVGILVAALIPLAQGNATWTTVLAMVSAAIAAAGNASQGVRAPTPKK